MILSIMGKSEELIEFSPDRPGHDRKYALSSKKIKTLGWRSIYSLESALKNTVDYYLERQ